VRSAQLRFGMRIDHRVWDPTSFVQWKLSSRESNATPSSSLRFMGLFEELCFAAFRTPCSSLSLTRQSV